MRLRKMMVLTTDQILRIEGNLVGLRNGHFDVVDWIEDHTAPGERVAVLTTHVLERALEQGFEVFVFSPRRAAGSHDTWWRQQLPTRNVVFAGDFVLPGETGLAKARQRAVHVLAARMGVRWPSIPVEGAKPIPYHWEDGIKEMARKNLFFLARDIQN